MNFLKTSIIAFMAGSAILPSVADEINVTEFNFYGPYPVVNTVKIGDQSAFEKNSPLDLTIKPADKMAQRLSVSALPKYDKGEAVNLLSFDIENRSFTEAEIEVEGIEDYVVMCDGEKVAAKDKIKLHPATHRIDIKYVSKPEQNINPVVKVKSSKEDAITLPTDGKRMFTLEDVLYGTRINKATLSPSGKYLMVDYKDADEKDSPIYWQKLYNAKTLKPMATLKESAKWMQKEDKYYVERKDFEHRRHIVAIDPATGEESILASNIPDGDFVLSPNGDYLLFNLVREGLKENPKAYQVLEPEDRQPGWRDRHYPAILRLDGNGAMIPLVQSEYDTQLADISNDGNKILLFSSRSDLGKRPSLVFDIIMIDVNTMEMDTIVAGDGFITGASFSPDGTKVLVQGSPEAFGRIGCILPDDVIPSMIEQDLFIVDTATKQVEPLTRDFVPSIVESVWSKNDGKIYARCENRDLYTLYRIDPKTKKAEMLGTPENVIKGFNVVPNSNMMAWWGQSDSNPDGAYVMNLKTLNNQVFDRPSDSRLKNVRLSKCEDWNFVNSKGDTIYGRRYLPDNFDPNKKYPLIVNYYGGCSPSQRYFESRYPWHIYAQLGYVIYVVQPSGATGFGQEFSSRHVSTAGKGVAEDIIEGAQKFIKEHDFVDASRVGCIGASYGGFMTQYLQTQTDMFKTAISHAGISDHTSYWGEGWWGYTYSETAMGENLPWTNTDLYVKQSPLYNVDKIKTPILFLHGDVDYNVPVGESIQMFTALKRLGKDAALVFINGEGHHIQDFEKRKLWQDTIFAWFAKYLQADDSWWKAMYPAQGK